MSDAIDLPTISAAIATWVKTGSGLDDAHVWWEFEKRPRPSVPYIALSVRSIRSVGYDWHTNEDNPLVASGTVSAVDTTANALTAAGHGLQTGDGPFHFASTGTLPAPLVAGTDYWIIAVNANQFKLAAAFEDTGGQQPLGSGNPQTPIDLTTAGTGVITFASTVDTLRAGQEIIRHAQGHRIMTLRLECLVGEGAGYDAMRIMENVRSQLELSVDDLDLAGMGLAEWSSPIQLLEGRRAGILEPRATWEAQFHLASNITDFYTIITALDAEIDLIREDGVTEVLPAIPVHVRLP